MVYKSCPFNNSIDVGSTYGLLNLYLAGSSEDFYLVIICNKCNEHDFRIDMKSNDGKLYDDCV